MTTQRVMPTNMPLHQSVSTAVFQVNMGKQFPTSGLSSFFPHKPPDSQQKGHFSYNAGYLMPLWQFFDNYKTGKITWLPTTNHCKNSLCSDRWWKDSISAESSSHNAVNNNITKYICLHRVRKCDNGEMQFLKSLSMQQEIPQLVFVLLSYKPWKSTEPNPN